jgi:Zn-dependent M28 family amino/carboxypeptidase
VPAASLVADINADSGLAIYPPREMLTIGAEESTLSDDVRRAAAALGLGVGKDPEPRQSHAVRSDQYNFLRHGIPATTTGVGPGGATEVELKAAADFRRTHYHRVTDAWEPDRDYRPAATVARFQFLLGLSLAERPTRPTFLPASFSLRPGGH